MSGLEDWLVAHDKLATFIMAVVSAVVTLSAVLVAWRTAASTKRTVAEMRETRLQAVRPVLYISATQRSFEVWFEPDKDLDPKLVFPAPEGEAPKAPFEIRNAVDAPAFDVRCDWNLGREAELEEGFKLASLKQGADRKSVKISYGEGVIKVDDDDGFSLYDNWKYSRSAVSNHLEILGGKAKPIRIPDEIKYQIVCLALLKAEKQQIYSEWSPALEFPLTLSLSCSAPSGERIAKRFNFKMSVSFSRFVGSDGKITPRGQLPSDWASVRVSVYIETEILEAVVLVNPSFSDLLKAAALTASRMIGRSGVF